MNTGFRGLLVAAFIALAPAAQAVPLVNPGFETGDLTGWDTSGAAIVISPCAPAFIGCAPGGGNAFAVMNLQTVGTGNASIRQNVAGVGAGSYDFGAWVSFATDDPAGNFDQGQINLTVQGTTFTETVGFDPNALNGQFTIPVAAGFSATPWFLLSGTLDYAGGPGDFLINMNVQDFTPDQGLVLLVDNVFLTSVAPIPLPAGFVLIGTALAGLGAVRRFGRS